MSTQHTNRKRSWSAFILVGAAASVLALPALAQDSERKGGNWGPHVAWTKSADADEGNFLVGGHLELALARALGIQGAVEYRSDETFHLRNGDQTAEVNVRTIPITATGRLYLPAGDSFAPFLAVGAGWYNLIHDYSDALEAIGAEDETVTTFGWHAGAGARVYLSPSVSLSGEGRYTFLDPERDFEPDVQDNVKELDYDTAYLGAGLNLEF
jgi:opacity protein-like surface antigen